MKRYRAYKAKKFKLPRRILFFCIVALIITVLAIILGNFLKNKLETVPRDTSEILTETKDPAAPPSKDNNEEAAVSHDKALGSVVAGYLRLDGTTDEESARLAIDELKSAGCNAVSFVVTDGDGRLTYASPAIEEDSRLPASKEIVTYDMLTLAVAYAKEQGLRASAVMDKSDSIYDEVVAEELSLAGFDELIVRGFEGFTRLDNSIVSEIGDYIKRIRTKAGDMAISLSFVSEFFSTPSNAPYIEKIYAKTEFLSIDLTDHTPEEITAVTETISGSISAYLLRPLLSGDNEEQRLLVDEALAAAFFNARQYVSAPERLDEDTSEPDGSDTTAQPPVM
ncbi:MAG: hypothetical protein IKL24_01575 [Clostridia bacterium]|nr:hypothetical protein [Clostridia bacterium]